MARKPTRKGAAEAPPEHPPEPSSEQTLDDTANRSLSKDERRRLSIDAWEPSLLRHLLEAEDKLRRR